MTRREMHRDYVVRRVPQAVAPLRRVPELRTAPATAPGRMKVSYTAVDPRPRPFEDKGRVKYRVIGGQRVKLKLYRNADGCEVWCSAAPTRVASTTVNHGNAYDGETF